MSQRVTTWSLSYYNTHIKMKTVNSLSGGRTSSYIAVHYPADYEIFALCCIEDHNAGRDIDKKIKQMVNDKLEKYCPYFNEFVATSEDPKILTTMFDLEQKIGREIIWLRGLGWENMVLYKKAMPNRAKRFCTTIMKIQPMFEFLYLREQLPVKMRIGFRYDEIERMNTENTKFKFAHRCEYQEKSDRWINRWEEVEWRTPEFPLIEDKIIHSHIRKYWDTQSIEFPEDSNCQNCFWKSEQQLRKNFDTNAPIMLRFMCMEDMRGYTFKDNMSFQQIRRLPVQLDFFYGTGAGCQAGFCTD